MQFSFEKWSSTEIEGYTDRIVKAGKEISNIDEYDDATAQTMIIDSIPHDERFGEFQQSFKGMIKLLTSQKGRNDPNMYETVRTMLKMRRSVEDKTLSLERAYGEVETAIRGVSALPDDAPLPEGALVIDLDKCDAEDH
jgi:hypothetical protein